MSSHYTIMNKAVRLCYAVDYESLLCRYFIMHGKNRILLKVSENAQVSTTFCGKKKEATNYFEGVCKRLDMFKMFTTLYDYNFLRKKAQKIWLFCI